MIKAVIFDMDGVVSDTQKLHSQVESKLLNNCGIQISPQEITEKFSGVKTSYFFKELLDQNGIKADIDSLMADKWNQMVIAAGQDVKPIPGIRELINRLEENNFIISLAAASVLKYINIVLDRLNLKNKFQVITSAEQVVKGKPEPDLFLFAANKLKVPPENCLVIEDGRAGMTAAKRAKMKCIGLVSDKKIPNRYFSKKFR